MRVHIDSMSYGPDGVGRIDGKVVFVSGAVTGDTVEANITTTGKNYCKAQAIEVIEPSPLRTTPPCPYASVCGGCPWSSLNYEAQSKAKMQNLCDTLTRIAHFDTDLVQQLVRDVVTPSETWGYRNKIELNASQTSRGLVIGMHGINPDEFIRIDSCKLLNTSQHTLIKGVAGSLGFLGRGRDLGIERVGIRTSTRTKQTEIALWTDPAAFPRAEVAKVFHEGAHSSSLVRVMTKGVKAQRRIAGIETLDGHGYWAERIAGRKMRLSAPSFFQVNTVGAEHLVNLVLDSLGDIKDSFIADLYCGAGTFTLPLAAAGASVVGIESSGPAIRDLERNLSSNGLDDMVECIGDEAQRQLDVLDEVHAVVVDPPRSGLVPEVIQSISRSDVQRVVYVSCDPATLARDLSAFTSIGTFRPVQIHPVDMFPQTYHLETVCLMSRA